MRSYPNVRRPARLRLGVIIGFAIAVALALITGCGPAGQDSSIEERLGSGHAFPREGFIAGEYGERYENGQLKMEGDYDTLREWHENGRLKREINFVNGQMEGAYQSWHEGGERHVQANYLGGAREGGSTQWYRNGQIRETSKYKDGRPDGPYLGWYIGGEKRFAADYVNGKIDGVLIEWSVSGEILSQQKYKNGVLVRDAKN